MAAIEAEGIRSLFRETGEGAEIVRRNARIDLSGRGRYVEHRFRVLPRQGGSIRASVQTRMAVRKVGVFRSVRTSFAHAWKIVRNARFIGTCTLARFGSAIRERRAVLSREIARPSILEAAALVSLGVRSAGRVHRLRRDAKGP